MSPFHLLLQKPPKDVNTVPEAVPVWPSVRYISDTSQYRCTVSGLLLFYIFNICIYTHTHIHTHTHTKSLFTIKQYLKNSCLP